MKYVDELTQAMSLCADQPESIFLGQAIAYPGTGMTQTFLKVPPEKLIELPVMEDCQLGMAIGLSLAGKLPICVYPRINFLLLAVNQLVLHLDKIPDYSEYRPKVIIRTAIATPEPLDPGPQHLGDYVSMLRPTLKNVDIWYLNHAKNIGPSYEYAIKSNKSMILVEYSELYLDG
jgi:pyruvate/2-oxoglutarate/acetoin dehydrogenase E1 component